MADIQKKVVNVERRTWDIAAYEARAKQRAGQQANDGRVEDKDLPSAAGTTQSSSQSDDIKEEFRPADSGGPKLPKSERSFLKARTRHVDLESKVGTTEIVVPPQATAESSIDDTNDSVTAVLKNKKTGQVCLAPTSAPAVAATTAGWHCSVCDCYLKDSMTYLDHINGRKHQRKLGYGMIAHRSTVEEAEDLLADISEAVELKKKEKKKKGKMKQATFPDDEEEDGHDPMKMFKNKIMDNDAEEERARKKRRDERKRKRMKKKKEKEKDNADVSNSKENGMNRNGIDENGYENQENDETDNMKLLMGFSGFK
mmetsp:Transcript_32312/g.74436  ORF Transcript_32312/g.74436 Transcript_32312/m.74436 type:complete len:313 (-) Transcript_32312:168-1106(-)